MYVLSVCDVDVMTYVCYGFVSVCVTYVYGWVYVTCAYACVCVWLVCDMCRVRDVDVTCECHEGLRDMCVGHVYDMCVTCVGQSIHNTLTHTHMIHSHIHTYVTLMSTPQRQSTTVAPEKYGTDDTFHTRLTYTQKKMWSEENELMSQTHT